MVKKVPGSDLPAREAAALQEKLLYSVESLQVFSRREDSNFVSTAAFTQMPCCLPGCFQPVTEMAELLELGHSGSAREFF